MSLLHTSYCETRIWLVSLQCNTVIKHVSLDHKTAVLHIIREGNYSINRLRAIDSNWRHICNLHYGRLTPNGVNAAFSPFFVLSTKILRSTSGLWLATNHHTTQLWLQIAPLAIVTGFEKTFRMRFFRKIEFDVWLISPTIELTCVQVLDRLCASLLSYRALFVIAPYPQQSRNHGLKALLCTHMAFPYTMCIPEVN